MFLWSLWRGVVVSLAIAGVFSIHGLVAEPIKSVFDEDKTPREIEFDLLNWGEYLDIEKGKLTIDGVRLKLRPNYGVINQTTTRLGITDEDQGSAVSLIDGMSDVKGYKPEALALSFNCAVEVLEIHLSSFTEDGKNSEQAKLSYRGQEVVLKALPEAKDIYKFNNPIKLSKMEKLTLTWVRGNGFSLDAIKIRTIHKKGSLD